MKLVFANNPLGTPEASPESAGWKTVTQDGDNAPGEGVSDKVDELKTIVLKPIRKKRRPTPQAGTELGLARPWMKRTNYGGDPAKYQQPYTPWKDESAREFYYAPGEAGLTGAAKKAPPIPEEVYSFLKNLEDPGSGSEQVGEFFVAYEVFTDVCWDGLDKTIDMQRLAKETIDNLTVDQGVSGKIHDSGWLRSGKYGQDDVVYAIWWIPQDVNIEAAKPNMTWEERNAAEKASRDNAFKILDDPRADPKVVKRLCHAVDGMIRQRAAGHQNAPVEELTRLARSMDADDREAVAENSVTPPEVLTQLAKTPYLKVQFAVAQNPKSPAEALAILSKSKSKEIQSAVADNPNTPADMAKFLQENSEDYQLKQVRKEDQTPEVLNKLATSSMYWSVRERAIAHPNMSSENLLNLTKGKAGVALNDDVLSSVANSDNITPLIAERLNALGSTYTREVLALNPKCPQEVIKKMSEEISADIADGASYAQGDKKRLRDAVIKRLPTAEQVALSSDVPKGFSKEPVKNVDYKRYALRQLEKAMEAAGVKSLKKADLGQPAFQRFKGNPYIEQVFTDNKGVLSLEQLQQAKTGKTGKEYYLHHGQYDSSSVQSDAEFGSLPRKTFSLGFKDTDISPAAMDFLDDIAPKLKHSNHSIGLGGKNLGWILWKDLSGLEPYKSQKQKTYLIEQVQSDWRDLVPKLRTLKEQSEEIAEKVEEFEKKHGGPEGLDQVQKEINELVKNYPEKLIGAFLEEASGAKVYMTSVEKAQALTSMSPTTAKIIYQDAAKRFGFEPAPELPGYQEVLASQKLVFATEDTLYQDDEAMAYGTGFPAPQGGSDVIEDTNLTPRQYPRPVRFGDKYRRLDYQKKGYPPTGIPEPLPTQTVQNDNMTYPLSSGLLFAAEDPSKLTWYFGAPEAGKTYNEGKSKLHSFTVAIYDTEESDKPVLNLTFYVKQTGNKLSIPKGDYDLSFFNQKEGEARFGVADLDRLGAGVEDSIFGQLPQDVVQQAKETVIPPTPEEQAKRDEKKAQQDKAQADKDTAAGAPQAQTEEAKAKAELAQAKVEHLKVKTEQEKAKTQETLRKAEEKKAKDAEKAADKATKDAEKAKEKAQTSTAPLPAQAKEAAPAVNIYEGYSKEVADELENIKKESPEEYAQALKEIGIEPPAAVPAEEGKADAVKEHAPDSPVPTEKKETPARPGYNVLDDPVLKEIAPKMDPEEKLFTGIKSWEDDLFSADPSKLDETTLALLDKKKQGAGQYFSWNYQSQDDVDEAQKKQEEEKGFTVDMKPTLVIKRLEPWKSIQDEVFKKRKASRGKK